MKLKIQLQRKKDRQLIDNSWDFLSSEEAQEVMPEEVLKFFITLLEEEESEDIAKSIKGMSVSTEAFIKYLDSLNTVKDPLISD